MQSSNEPDNDQPDRRLGLLGSYGITPKNNSDLSVLINTLRQIVGEITVAKTGTANLKKADVQRLQAVTGLTWDAQQERTQSNVTMEAFDDFKKQVFERLDGKPFVAGAAGTPDTTAAAGKTISTRPSSKGRTPASNFQRNEKDLRIDLRSVKSDHPFKRADIPGKQQLVNQVLKDFDTSQGNPPTDTPQILSLRALPNGDVVLYFPSREAAAWAKTHCKAWSKMLCPEARPRPELIQMALDGVPLSFAKTTDARSTILRENPLINPSDLIEAKWLSKTEQTSKTYGTMLLTFLSQDSAKRALQNNIHISMLPCNLRIYVPHPTQCYKCQGFGHFATDCRLQPKCARCAGDHFTKDCSCNHPDSKCSNRKECTHIPTKCANCKQDHVSFDRRCPALNAARERLESLP